MGSVLSFISAPCRTVGVPPFTAMVAFPFSSKLSRKGLAGSKADNPGGSSGCALTVGPAIRAKLVVSAVASNQTAVYSLRRAPYC
jgi:hypothetical protein